MDGGGASPGGPRLILGSASPRRLDLLAQIGVVPDEIRPSDIDETEMPGETPRAYCARVSRQKAEAVGVQPGEIVLTADTTVALGRRILGKPAGRAEAAAFLQAFSGRRHRVITTVTVAIPGRLSQKTVTSTVRMRQILPSELEAYLDSGDWQGKAGGYGIQGPAGAFVPWISGSFSAIVGLPLSETAGLLRGAGLRLGAGVA